MRREPKPGQPGTVKRILAGTALFVGGAALGVLGRGAVDVGTGNEYSLLDNQIDHLEYAGLPKPNANGGPDELAAFFAIGTGDHYTSDDDLSKAVKYADWTEYVDSAGGDAGRAHLAASFAAVRSFMQASQNSDEGDTKQAQEYYLGLAEEELNTALGLDGKSSVSLVSVELGPGSNEKKSLYRYIFTDGRGKERTISFSDKDN